MNYITTRITSLYAVLREAYREHTKTTWIATGLILVSVLIIVFTMDFGNDTEDTDSTARIPTVEVASVGALSRDESQLEFLGEVRSVSQAQLRAQKPGKITAVYVTSGDRVAAGSIIAQLENASERAAVLSAQGTVDLAQAQLDKVLAGARGEDKASTIVQAEAAIISLDAAQDSARNAYSQAFTLAQNAIQSKVDEFFSNPYTVNPSFRVRSASFDERQVLEKERVAIGEILAQWETKTKTSIENADLDSHLLEAEGNLERIKQFLTRISGFVSEQKVGEPITATQKASQEATILGARTNIDTARTAINGARSSLANRASAAQVAKLQESKTIVGARSEDVASAEASLTQARGSLASAYAALENTLFRTPISGTVSTLNVNTGDFVSSFESIAVIANEGAQEIEAYVSDTLRKRITAGQAVLIDSEYEGTITSVEPGLDPVTKKSRVTIGINSDDANLVNGSYANVEVVLDTMDVPAINAETEISIPITAVKVLPRGFAVFIVNSENMLEVVPITEGPIVGDKMIIPEGLTQGMKIVVDARGLIEGETVEVVESEI